MCFAAVSVCLWGCQADRPNQELAELRAQPAPAWQSLMNPVKGHQFADTWGAARSGGRRHEGVDIFADKGTPVRSTTEGIVTKRGKNRLTVVPLPTSLWRVTCPRDWRAKP